jgi:hypothetical protein
VERLARTFDLSEGAVEALQLHVESVDFALLALVKTALVITDHPQPL